MSDDQEYIVMDEDPPKYEEELLKSPPSDSSVLLVQETKIKKEPETVDLVDDDDDADLPLNGSTNTGELCLQDMQVLDEVKGDEEDPKPMEQEELKTDMANIKTSVDNTVPSQETAELPTEQVVKEDASTQSAASAPNLDPYAYLGQGGYTSENFKIELRGLPRYYGLAELKKLLNETLKLEYNKVKPPQMGKNHMFICFRSEQGRKQALETLHGFVWKKAKLIALPAKAAPDPLVRKRKQETEQGGAKTPKIDPAEKLKQSATPFWDKPYNTQLANKMDIMKKSLKEMGKQIVKVNPQFSGWLKKQEEKFNGLPCELRPIRPSPQIDGYRNKCEFTIGLHPDTEKPTVGFRLGSYVSGEVGVYPADDLTHIPDIMKQCAKVFSTYVSQSPMPPYHPEERQGFWQSLSVRTTRGGQLMITVSVHIEGLKEGEEEKLKQDITKFFVEDDGKQLKVDSLYFHPLVRKAKGITLPEPVLLHGEPYITEDLLGLKLRISPLAFFQVNTLAAEELYQAVSELAQPTPDTTLLDICCGTGSIGLSLAKDCGQVLGLEMIQAAVGDAKANAKANDLNHCEFFTGLAENVLGSVLDRATRPDFVGVLDPPRPGVPQRVIATIRRSQQLNRLVYMACSPAAALHNFRDLARPQSKTMPGNPMLPVCAIPVDLFPHTPHCELVVLFERVDPNALPPPLPGSLLGNFQGQDGNSQDRKNKKNKNKRQGGGGGGGGGNNMVQPLMSGEGENQDNAPIEDVEIIDVKHVKRQNKPRNKLWKRLIKRGVVLERPGVTIGEQPASRYNYSKYSVYKNRDHLGQRQAMTGRQPYQGLAKRGQGRGFGSSRGNAGPKPGGFNQFPQQSKFRLDNRPGGKQLQSLMSTTPVVDDFPEEVGRSWGTRISSNALHNEELLRREEEEAVRRFKEGFSAAIKNSQSKLLGAQGMNTRRNEEPYEEHDNYGRSHDMDFGYNEPSAARFDDRSAPIRPRPYHEEEKMVPMSTVTKILDNYRRGLVQPDALQEPRESPLYSTSETQQIKIREVYIEKESWRDNRGAYNKERDYPEDYPPRKQPGYNEHSLPQQSNLPSLGYRNESNYRDEGNYRAQVKKNSPASSNQHSGNQDNFQHRQNNSFRGKGKRNRKRKNNFNQDEGGINEYSPAKKPQIGRAAYNPNKKYGGSSSTSPYGGEGSGYGRRGTTEYAGGMQAMPSKSYGQEPSTSRNSIAEASSSGFLRRRPLMEESAPPPSRTPWKKSLHFDATPDETGSSPSKYSSRKTDNTYNKPPAFNTNKNIPKPLIGDVTYNKPRAFGTKDTQSASTEPFYGRRTMQDNSTSLNYNRPDYQQSRDVSNTYSSNSKTNDNNKSNYTNTSNTNFNVMYGMKKPQTYETNTYQQQQQTQQWQQPKPTYPTVGGNMQINSSVNAYSNTGRANLASSATQYSAAPTQQSSTTQYGYQLSGNNDTGNDWQQQSTTSAWGYLASTQKPASLSSNFQSYY